MLNADRHTRTQHLLDSAVTLARLPGIAVEVRTGHQTWYGSAGMADTAAHRPRHPEDRFRIGSITKTFVATVMLQLAAENELDLDEPIGKRLPGLVRGNGHDGDAVTVRQLLNHTSGIFNYTLDQQALNQHDRHPPELLVQIAVAHPPHFAPGTSWAYSNTNYILAGLIIEQVTGRPLAEEIDHRISRPLQLPATYLPSGDDPTIHGRHVRHYTRLNISGADAETHDATEFDPSLFWAAGAMISTTGDLARFLQALLGGQLLPPALQHEMFATVPTTNWIPTAEYGLGISSLDLPHRGKAWGMGGATFGSWTYAYGTRDGKHIIVANVNGDWADDRWEDPIGILTDLLHTELGASTTTTPPLPDNA